MKEEACATNSSGPVHVDLERPAVAQLWGNVHRIIETMNSLMKPFLALFGVSDHNGMSPLLSCQINSPADMKALTEEFFCTPPKDKHDYPPNSSDITSDVIDPGANTTHAEEDTDASDGDGNVDNITAAVTKLVSNFVSESQQQLEAENNEENNNNSHKKSATIEHFYDNGTSIDSGEKVYVELKKMCCSTSISEMSGDAMNIMQLLELGRLEGDRGSTSFDSEVKSFQQRWFRAGTGSQNNEENNQTSIEQDTTSIYIERDSLISLTCKRGKASSVEYYRVLAFFTKHYKKWYPSYNLQRFPWNKDSKDVRYLVRMLKQNGPSWKEVELETDAHFGPSCVFRVCSMHEILNVGERLVGDGVFL